MSPHEMMLKSVEKEFIANPNDYIDYVETQTFSSEILITKRDIQWFEHEVLRFTQQPLTITVKTTLFKGAPIMYWYKIKRYERNIHLH